MTDTLPATGSPAPPGLPIRARSIGPAVAAFALLLTLVIFALKAGTPNTARWTLFGLIGACWLSFALAAALVMRMPVRSGVRLILIGAVALQVSAAAFPPQSTDDFFRYAWDGRVQVAGVDPYRYTPVDPALTGLRDEWLFPPECQAHTPVCTRMNHPTDPTIYPPVAQGAFSAVHLLTLPFGVAGGRARTWQVFAGLLALLTTLAVLRVLRRWGDQRRAVWWAWCPTVVFECGNNGHIDVLAALLVVIALAAAAAGRPGRAGLALGAAVATKVLPILVLPALLAPIAGTRGWWRRAMLCGGAMVALIVAVYLPHLFAVGPRVIGFLPDYLQQEGYDGHSRFPWLRLLLPNNAALAAGILIIVTVAWFVARRTDPAQPWQGAVVLVGVAFAVAGFNYPWYALLLVVLVALDGRWEWLAVAAAAYPGYFTHALDLPWTITLGTASGGALLVVVVVHLMRSRRVAVSP